MKGGGAKNALVWILINIIITITVIMASINMSDLSSSSLSVTTFTKKTKWNSSNSCNPWTCDRILRTSKTHSCCSDSNKHTHSHIYAPITEEEREACCTHTHKAGWRGDGSPQVKVFRLIVCGDNSFTKTQHYATMKANKHRDQWITVVVQPSGRFGG